MKWKLICHDQKIMVLFYVDWQSMPTTERKIICEYIQKVIRGQPA